MSGAEDLPPESIPAGVPRPGDMLLGKYQVERVLGRGGMGIVFAAKHLELDEQVAIKVLLPAAAASKDLVGRFLREGRAAVKIRSEHVARIRDVGKLENGAPFIAMEYLDGKDLSTILREQGRLSVQVAVDYVLQACEALAEAHALGIIHRDLKPANLFLIRRADGSTCIKVIDFGISKTTAEPAEMSLTRTNSIIGSPLYMSPEQMRSSRTVDARSDIWSLGIILHELLTGTTPHDADSMPELYAHVLTKPAPPLRRARPDAPAALEAAILCSLQADCELRFLNIADFVTAIAEFGSTDARASADRIRKVIQLSPLSAITGTSNAVSAVMPLPSSPGFAGTGSSWAGHLHGGKESRRTLVAVGIGAVVLLVLVASAIFLSGSHPPPTPTAAVVSPPPSALASSPASSVSSAPAVLPPPASAEPVAVPVASVKHVYTTPSARPPIGPKKPPPAPKAPASATPPTISDDRHG
ncbi:MAG: serine/threonine-protein kinase [Polyangiaceae bacterium]